MKRNKLITTLLALMLFMGAFSAPFMALSAYAYTLPDADTGSPQTESAIPATTGKTITPNGTGTVVDKLSSEDGKEFYTITTPDENVFYLVIDTERNGDNVYFLNAVTEDDLMALAEKKADKGTSTSAIPTKPPVPEQPEHSPSPEPEPPAKSDGGNGTLIFIIIAAIVVGGAGYYFKIYRPKQQASLDEPEDDFDDYNGEADDSDGYEPEENEDD